MLDILDQMEEWSREDGRQPLYAATVVGIEGSAVRGAGATMGISADGGLTGSVSGGCIESNAVAAAERLRRNMASDLLIFCPTDDPFLGSPAPCGGTVQVCVYPFSKMVAEVLRSRAESGKAGLWGVVIEGPEGWTGVSAALDERGSPVFSFADPGVTLRDASFGPGEREKCEKFFLKFLVPDAEAGIHEDGDTRIFICREAIVPHAFVVGGSHIGEALLRILKELKWRVSIADPRESFARPERFVGADTLLHRWPQEAFEKISGDVRSTAVAAITHNEEMDDEAVETGLKNGCFYIGVLGSRRTFSGRVARLKARGWTEEQLRRVHGPIGLDISAETPEEIALSIASEMVREYRQHRPKG